MSVNVVQAKVNLRDALDELGAQVSYVCLTLAPQAPKLNTTADGSLYLSLLDLVAWDRDMTAAALDVLEGELGRKMTLVRECAETLRGAWCHEAGIEALDSREIGEPAFPRRRS